MYELYTDGLKDVLLVDLGFRILDYADSPDPNVLCYVRRLPTQLQPLGRWSGDANRIIWTRHV